MDAKTPPDSADTPTIPGIPVQLRPNRVVVITTAAGEEIHIRTEYTSGGKQIRLMLPSGARWKPKVGQAKK